MDSTLVTEAGLGFMGWPSWEQEVRIASPGPLPIGTQMGAHCKRIPNWRPHCRMTRPTPVRVAPAFLGGA
jgi:hypothetical protein